MSVEPWYWLLHGIIALINKHAWPLQDVYKTGEQVIAAGGAVVRQAGPIPGLGTKILAITDPDGYKIVFVDEADFLAELA